MLKELQNKLAEIERDYIRKINHIEELYASHKINEIYYDYAIAREEKRYNNQIDLLNAIYR